MNKSRGMSLVLILAAMALVAAGGAQAQPFKGCYVAAGAACPTDSHTPCPFATSDKLVCIRGEDTTACPAAEADLDGVMRECVTKAEGDKEFKGKEFKGKGKGPRGPCLADGLTCPDNHTTCLEPNDEGVPVCIHVKDTTTECPADLNVVTRVCGTKSEGPRGSKGCYVADAGTDTKCPANHTECPNPNEAETTQQLVCIYDKDGTESKERCPTNLDAVERECGAVRACALPVPVDGTEPTCPGTTLPCANPNIEGATICVVNKDGTAECSDADELDGEIPECGDMGQGKGKSQTKKQLQNRRMQL
jgi:hypothetical protein